MSEEQSGFQLYKCKDCSEIVADPVIHSKEQSHYQGYIVKNIPVEMEESTEQKKAKKQLLKTGAEKLLSERGI